MPVQRTAPSSLTWRLSQLSSSNWRLCKGSSRKGSAGEPRCRAWALLSEQHSLKKRSNWQLTPARPGVQRNTPSPPSSSEDLRAEMHSVLLQSREKRSKPTLEILSLAHLARWRGRKKDHGGHAQQHIHEFPSSTDHCSMKQLRPRTE